MNSALLVGMLLMNSGEQVPVLILHPDQRIYFLLMRIGEQVPVLLLHTDQQGTVCC